MKASAPTGAAQGPTRVGPAGAQTVRRRPGK